MSSCVDIQVIPSSFEHSLVVMTTTHKTFHGPRAGRTFYHRRVGSVDKQGKKVMCDLEKRTDAAVFPGLQEGHDCWNHSGSEAGTKSTAHPIAGA